jgi:Spy/CpxP family protein refolding chaperone
MKGIMKKGFILFLLLILMGNLALAREKGRRGQEGPVSFVDNMKGIHKKLDLTDKQAVKIEVINKNYKKVLLKYAEQITPKHIRLQRISMDEPVDYVLVKKLLEEIAPIMIELHLLKMKHRDEVSKILNAKQRRVFRKLGERRMRKMRKGGHRRDIFAFD